MAIFVFVTVSRARSTSPAALLNQNNKNKIIANHGHRSTYPEPSFFLIRNLFIGSSFPAIGSEEKKQIIEQLIRSKK